MREPSPTPPRTGSLARAVLSPTMVAVGVLLTAAALGLRPAATALRAHYRKRPIELRRPLEALDLDRLPSFVKDTYERWIATPFEDLDTDSYLKVDLLDTTAPPDEQRVILFVTYYSDPEDKVPHTPEVCYRQYGFVVESMRSITLDVPGLTPGGQGVDARLLLMRGSRSHVALIYVFCVNGVFRAERNQVRWRIAWPGDRHVYFSKIEATAYYDVAADQDGAIARCRHLLEESLPILVNEHFPDTEVVRGHRSPASEPSRRVGP